ncbi:hypothetical protein M422DRAFT_164274, partial [Sphaerobolus stellatus SS14]
IIAGETDAVEFFTPGLDTQPAGGSHYIIGIHDKKTNTVVLRQAPLHVLSRQVKALKSLESLAVTLESQGHAQAKNTLGDAFGSKKAQQAIRAKERNRVDVAAMESVAAHLQNSIEANTESLPTKEEAKEAMDESRPIPRYNLHAGSPDQVYALHDIISEAELNSIQIGQMLSASDENSRISCLPYQRSSWINQHLKTEFLASKPNKTNIKILFYLSAMFLFRNVSVRDKAHAQKRMPTIPNDVLDGLISHFTESDRDGSKVQVTKTAETLLLTYMFALCLRLDNYATDPTLLATDLSMSVPEITKHFKQLGCKVEVLTASERAELGLGPATEKEAKRCILRVPVDFPKQRLRKRK